MALLRWHTVPLLACLFALCFAGSAWASTAPIVRLAGTGAGGLYVDATPVTAARPALSTSFGFADGIVYDSQQNGAHEFVFVDRSSNRLLRVDDNGNLVLFAGSGVPGGAVEDPDRYEADLAMPQGIAENVGIGGYRVTHVHFSGSYIRTITLATGGVSAGTAITPQPVDLSNFQNNQKTYAAANDHTVRLLTDSTLTLVAGGGGTFDPNSPTTSPIGDPSDVSADQNVDNRFIVATSSNVVWRVSNAGLASDTIVKVAGTEGSAGSTGDGGLATAAKLNDPRSTVLLDNGGFLVYDGGNRRIRRVSDDVAGATISTIAGNGTDGLTPSGTPANIAPLAADADLALSPDGLLMTQGAKAVVQMIPATAITSGPPSVSGSGTAAFTLASWDDLATYECKLDSGSFAPCQTYTGLGEGQHTLEARATTNYDTLLDTTPAQHVWTVDTSPPNAFAAVAPADGEIVAPQPTFTWEAASDPVTSVVRYELWIDGAKLAETADCCAIAPPAPLSDGVHTWEIRAIDQAGNARATAARAMTVSAPPAAVLNVAPQRSLIGRTVTFDGSNSGDSNGSVVRYEWDLDGNGSFETDTAGASQTTRAYNTPATLNIRLRVTDNDGLTGEASSLLTVSAQAPIGERLGVSINDGAQYTNDPDVVVFSVWPPFASNALISNDGGFRTAQSFPVAEQIKWKLDSSGPERLPKTIYVRFTGGGSVSETFQDDIILDETAPRVLAATVTAAAASGRVATASKTRRLRIRARDNASGVGHMQVTKSKRRPGKVRRFKARIAVPASGPVFVRVRDRARNWSKWRRAR